MAEKLQEAIENDDAKSVLIILQQNDYLLNDFQVISPFSELPFCTTIFYKQLFLLWNG